MAAAVVVVEGGAATAPPLPNQPDSIDTGPSTEYFARSAMTSTERRWSVWEEGEATVRVRAQWCKCVVAVMLAKRSDSLATCGKLLA